MTWYELFSNWLAQSPWPCPAIALLVCLESSPVIGLLIPGLILLPALGSLSGHGLVDFQDLFVCAMLGVVIADSIGYWLGRLGYTDWHRKLTWSHSHKVQRRIDALYKRFGPYTLFIGRIMWVIHPMVPMAAGALGMRPVSFYLIDLSATLLWLLLHLGGGHWLGVLWLTLDPANRIWMVTAVLLILSLITVVIWWRERHE